MTWISAKEAAGLLGYSEDYFRRQFCTKIESCLVVREWHGPRGGRRVLILRESVEAMRQAQIKWPA